MCKLFVMYYFDQDLDSFMVCIDDELGGTDPEMNPNERTAGAYYSVGGYGRIYNGYGGQRGYHLGYK